MNILIISTLLLFFGCSVKPKPSLYTESFNTKTIQTTNGDSTKIITQSTSYKKDLNDEEIRKRVNTSIDQHYNDVKIKNKIAFIRNSINYQSTDSLYDADLLTCNYDKLRVPNGKTGNWSKIPQGLIIRKGSFDVSNFGGTLSASERIKYKWSFITTNDYTAYKIQGNPSVGISKSKILIGLVYLSEGKTFLNIDGQKETSYHVILESKTTTQHIILKGKCKSYKEVIQ